jgi:tryptophan 2,3-dioxygenase
MSDLTYASYIRVSELLDLQEPRSQTDAPLARACEHFFIVTHQTSELWLAQVLLDLDEAGSALAEQRYLDAEECLQRSAVVLDVMASNLDVLATMPPGRFACFRGDLGRASGAQSGQFAQFDRLLGLGRRGDCPLFDALVEACRLEESTLEGLLRPTEPDHPELSRVVLAMLDVSRKTWKWKATHLELAARMLGHHKVGTGGTAGTRYLAGRLAMPFEKLWDAVSAMQQDAQ